MGRISLVEIAGMSEGEAREVFESIRWPEGPVCPHCGSKRAFELKGKATRSGLYKCSSCRKQFTVTVKTVMHRTHIPLKKWLLAMYLMLSGRKGVPAIQIWRDLNLGSYKTAYFLLQRIREAMDEDDIVGPLSGIVEVDETYVGGKGHKRGRGSEKKAVFMVMVERHGRAITRHIESASATNLKREMLMYMSRDAALMTDEWAAYQKIGPLFKTHLYIEHKRHRYVDGILYTNTAESFWSLVKRSYKGIYHYISHKHLNRYGHEFCFRWNHRQESLRQALIELVRNMGGKRLTSRELYAYAT